MNSWEFNIGDEVNISPKENGTIIGRAEYIEGPNMFRVEYVTGDGRLVESWFQARELSKLS